MFYFSCVIFTVLFQQDIILYINLNAIISRMFFYIGNTYIRIVNNIIS